MKLTIVLLVLVVAGGCQSSSNSPGAIPSADETLESPRPVFVKEQVSARLSPSFDSKATNTLYRGERVELFETRSGWGRVSRYYDGAVEGEAGEVARWLPISFLTTERPVDLLEPVTATDPRIGGIPKVGEGGLTVRDVLVLQAAGRFFLETGKAQRIEYGDKSLNRPGTYYLNFGGSRNHFFSPADIPDLEDRIDSLSR